MGVRGVAGHAGFVPYLDDERGDMGADLAVLSQPSCTGLLGHRRGRTGNDVSAGGGDGGRWWGWLRQPGRHGKWIEGPVWVSVTMTVAMPVAVAMRVTMAVVMIVALGRLVAIGVPAA